MYQTHYFVQKPLRFTRIQLAVRFVAFCALAVLGISFGMIFLFAYLALPAFAASRLAVHRDPEQYLLKDGPMVLRAIRWFAAVSAWAGLVADQLPGRTPDETVTIDVEGTAFPRMSSALWRVITGLPSAFVLLLLGVVGGFVWLWAAVNILFTQQIGPHAFNYLVGLQRWSIRLIVYQASLVDEYPPFSFADVAPPAPQPQASAMP